MKNLIIAGILLILLTNYLQAKQASLADNDDDNTDDVLKELLKELKIFKNKYRLKTENNLLDVTEARESQDDDEDNSDGQPIDSVVQITDIDKKYDEAKKHSNNESSLSPKYKFYGDDPNVDPCSSVRPRVLSDPHGTIYSPGYETNIYGNNRICSWKFVAPPGDVVELTVITMDIESNLECRYDSLEVFDVINKKGIPIGKYCGSSRPMELLQSTDQLLYVYFITDDTNDKGKFEIRYRMVTPKLDEPSTFNCGRPPIEPNIHQRIVGGEPARPFSWPWIVSIRILQDNQWVHDCGGSILSENVIITAAHCLYDPNKKKMRSIDTLKIVAGEYDEKTSNDGPTQLMSVKLFKIHNKYNRLVASSPDDIAVIILEGKLKYNDHVIPVCLPREEPRLTSLCYVAGWGITDNTGDRTVLNQVRLPIVNHNTCKRSDYYGIYMLDSMICAGFEEGGRDACQNDSGGPLVCYNAVNNRYYLHGIASWGIGCAQPMKPGVYTRVTSYIDWIYSNCGVRQ